MTTLSRIDEDICPFFDTAAGICSIYPQRPLSCRAFPITDSGVLTYLAGREASPAGEIFCMKGIIPRLPRMDRRKFITPMNNSLGEQFWHAVQADLALDFVRKLARDGVRPEESGEEGAKVMELFGDDTGKVKRLLLKR
jgi:hypothetical protein